MKKRQIQIGKEVKSTLLTNSIPEMPQRLYDLMNVLNKVGGYKMNRKKNIAAFLYTKNERAEKEIRKTIPLTIASKYS